MNNAMQLKAAIKKISKEKNIAPQLVLQNYMLERFLERVSVSPYLYNFITKGGFLISAIIGLDSRTTMDLDATLKHFPVTKEKIEKMIREIIAINLSDDISFTLRDIYEIRENDEYSGYRVSLTANYSPMAVPIKLDITTGDKITPREIELSYKLMLENRNIKVFAYNLATILAEKLESIISRGDQNTRPRDYYDVYILSKLQSENIDPKTLKDALLATSKKRGSLAVLKDYEHIIQTVRNSKEMQNLWNNYQLKFEYANGISFINVCDSIETLLNQVCSDSPNSIDDH